MTSFEIEDIKSLWELIPAIFIVCYYYPCTAVYHHCTLYRVDQTSHISSTSPLYFIVSNTCLHWRWRNNNLQTYQTWAQDTFKISSSRPSSYYYIQQESLVSKSSRKCFMCQSSSSKQNENQAIQALSKKTEVFLPLILLTGWI